MMLDSWEGERKRVGLADKKKLYAAQKKRCMYCGFTGEVGRFHVDHKTPVARGGNNRFTNYQLYKYLIKECHGKPQRFLELRS